MYIYIQVLLIGDLLLHSVHDPLGPLLLIGASSSDMKKG